jgi:hypothetical protein
VPDVGNPVVLAKRQVELRRVERHNGRVVKNRHRSSIHGRKSIPQRGYPGLGGHGQKLKARLGEFRLSGLRR